MRIGFRVNIYCVEDVKQFHKYLPWDPENPSPCVKGKVLWISGEIENSEISKSNFLEMYQGSHPEEGWFSVVEFAE